MCDKRNSVIAKIHGGDIRLDPCLREQIIKLNYIAPFTVASCCGHYRYPETILVMYDLGTVREIRSGVIIPRKRRFRYLWVLLHSRTDGKTEAYGGYG